MLKSNISDRRPRSEKYRRKIKLISGGYACPAAFPNGEITVLPWDSAIDHWLSETSDSAQGAARDRILYDLMAKVCLLGECKLEEFVLGDVNSILLVARSIANMNKVEYVTTCPSCGEQDVDEISVPDELKPVGAKDANYKGVDVVILDDSKDAVAVRPLRIGDSLAIVGRAPEAKKRISDMLAITLAPIVSVNDGQADRIEELVEWYNWLHPHDIKQLEDFCDANTPHLSQDVAQQCGKCHAIYPHRLVLDQNFFRSGRMGSLGRALAADL